MTSKARAVELTDIPPPEPNMSTARVVILDGATLLIYEANPYIGDHQRGWVLIELHHCALVSTGGPNDEGLGHYRPGGAALEHYTNQEIENSPLIASAVALSLFPRMDHRKRQGGLRHFIFAFKEEALECLATGYRHLGTHETFDAALEAARKKGLGD